AFAKSVARFFCHTTQMFEALLPSSRAMFYCGDVTCQEMHMPMYELGDSRPVVPAEGEYWVAPNASLIGRVRLLKGASVWFGSVLRGDNDWITIGENTNIQDLCVLHTDPGILLTLGSNVSVGHAAVIHGAIVGD